MPSSAAEMDYTMMLRTFGVLVAVYFSLYNRAITALPLEKPLQKVENDVWLEDLYTDQTKTANINSQANDDLQAQSKVCPLAEEFTDKAECELVLCTSDEDCSLSNQRCCYNGCVWTCLYTLGPPPDWLTEPPRRISNGTSWLIQGDAPPPQGEPCLRNPVTKDDDPSLSDDGDPLLCPEGFVCQVLHEGHSDDSEDARGGHCVPVYNAKVDISSDTQTYEEHNVQSDGASDLKNQHSDAYISHNTDADDYLDEDSDFYDTEEYYYDDSEDDDIDSDSYDYEVQANLNDDFDIQDVVEDQITLKRLFNQRPPF